MVPVLAVLLLATSAFATDFNNCESGPPPVAVRVRGCDAQPCSFTPGNQVHVETDFNVDHTCTALTPAVKATVLGLTVNYPLPSDGCKNLIEASCPLQDGEVDTHVLELTIPPIEIESDVVLEYSLVDQDQKVLACFIMNGKVVIDSK